MPSSEAASYPDDLPAILQGVRRICLVHVPKTGGTFMNRVVGPALEAAGVAYRSFDHAVGVPFPRQPRRWQSATANGDWGKWTAGRGLPCYRDEPVRGSVRVALVRNPFDLLVSLYFNGEHGFGDVSLRHGFSSFGAFAEAFCDPSWTWVGGAPCPLLQEFLFSQLFDERGRCGVRLVLRFERLEEAVNEILRLTGGSPVRARGNAVNPSRRRRFRDHRRYYSPSLARRVEAKCRRELRLFGYCFEGPVESRAILDPRPLRYDPCTDS